VPIIKEGDKIFLMPISEFTPEETQNWKKNYRAFNILFCALDSNEFNHMSACDITKEV